jgi:transposase
LSLCHHVYPGNVPDTEEFSNSMPRLLRFLDDSHIARDTVTLVFDKGSAALYNTLDLDQSGVGWISALPWNQAPPEFREMPLEKLKPLTSPARAVAHPVTHKNGRKGQLCSSGSESGSQSAIDHFESRFRRRLRWIPG